MSGDPYVDGVNRGPYTGGMYDNDDNARETGGVTHTREATSVTGEMIAEMPVEIAPITGSERQATAAEMCGGNADSSM